ncbi:MAG TPA: carboxypeptidase-like regulatory domain-containing protein [Bryobacteraceae bacterium]|nr:carboxypeptidase-like regulatory domain-containing protein [Bryobacteraceae bacterium]
MSLYAQSAPTSLHGRVLYPDGSPVPNAPIQAKHNPDGALARTRSDANGAYQFTNLAGGKWDFTIQMPCCAYSRVSKEVDIAPEKNQQLDINLVETINGSTLGDDPARNADAMRKRQHVRSGPAPRTAAGLPDFSGVWLLTDDPYPETPQLTPAADARMKALAKDPRNAPHNRCLPGPPPLPGASSPFIAKFVQSPSVLVAMFEDYPGFRQIFLDGRKHPADLNPSWMGHSIGRWQKDTLIVDTIGFNDLSLLGGIGGGPFPHTEALRMTERYRRIDYGHMDLNVTFEDAQAFTAPYHENLTLTLAPREELLEFVCENNKPEHLVTTP